MESEEHTKPNRLMWALVTVLFVLGLGYWYFKPDACATPLTYRIGQTDLGFGISRSEILSAAFNAESVWEDPTFLNLLEYREDGDITINFLYDERQENTVQEKRSRDSLDDSRRIVEYNLEQYEELTSDLEVLRKRYNNQKRQYEVRLSRYELSLEQPTDSQRTLDERKEAQTELSQEFERLDELRREVNMLVERINQIAGSGGIQIEQYNQAVDTYNQEFAGTREFDQGDYTSDGVITIYQFEDKNDLTVVLAHEFGHALGLGHVLDPQAIMHYQLSAQDMLQPRLAKADIIELQRHCSLVRGI